ncbi:MAG: ATP-binding cassette domain-containing protein, partial [Deltaproteobacteria bacterium]|nr:ATP-binding cassette domain-containing protein [Deltaproteobacteria bacterium]
MIPALETQGASLRYPLASAPALSGLDVRLFPGELLAVVGRSGGGKSTFLRLVNGTGRLHFGCECGGTVRVRGRDQAARSLYEISGEVSTVFQNPEDQFFALTPRDEMLLSWECRGVSEARAGALLVRWSRTLGLEGMLDRQLNLLSSGEKQKTVLASKLALSPALLLLDEPSSNLDPPSRQELAESLVRLKSEGLAIIVVDHRLRWLRGAADRVLVLQDGRPAWQGPFEALLDPAFTDRWGLRRASDARQGAGATPASVGTSAACPPSVADASTGAGSTPAAYASSAAGGAAADAGGAGKLLAETGNSGAPGSPAPVELGEGVGFRGLGFGYPGRGTLFDGFSGEIPCGMPTLIAGVNGAGKTTLMRLASGLLKPHSGIISFGGKALPAHSRLARSSLVFQIADRQLCMSTVRDEILHARRAGNALKAGNGVRDAKAGNAMRAAKA